MDNQFIIFLIAGRRFGLPIESIVQAIRAVEVTRIPNAPDTIAGIVNVRGCVLPVLDARARLGLDRKPISPDDHFLLVAAGNRRFVLIVDEVLGGIGSVPKVTASDVAPAIDQIDGVVVQPDGMILIARPEQFFLESDQGAFERMQYQPPAKAAA